MSHHETLQPSSCKSRALNSTITFTLPESDCQRQALGYGDDQYSDADYNKFDIVIDVRYFPGLFLVDKLSNWELNTKYDYGE